MKKLIIMSLAVVLFTACEQQEQRYFADSDQTKSLEAGLAAYESGDWDTWRSHFADTAKIYVNSSDPISVDDRLAQMREMTAAFNSYGFDKDDDHMEMVVDKNDETWVYYWATHNGTMTNNSSLSIPVHLAMRYNDDGKIVAEHIYFDGTELNAAMEAMMAEAETAEEAEDETTDMEEPED